MKFALDPQTRHEIDAESYIRRWGNKPLGATQDPRPNAICPVCGMPLSLVAGKTESTHGHFAHKASTGYCPTKSMAALPYGQLRPTHPDHESAKLIRALAIKRWRWIFKEIDQRVERFDATEFLALIKIADQSQLWAYRNLTLRQVPELLLMTRDFTPETSRFRERRYWFRFWFSANIRSIDDLWITPPDEVQVFRAAFHAPTGRKKLPDPSDCKEIKQLPRVHEVPPTDSVLGSFNESFIPSKLR